MRLIGLALPAVLGALTLAALASVPGKPASAGINYDDISFWDGSYGGTNSAGYPIAARIRADNRTADLITEVPLSTPCAITVIVKLRDMPIDADGNFFGTSGGFSGGGHLSIIAGRFIASPLESPYVSGALSGFDEGPPACSGGTNYEVHPEQVYHGDADCSWEQNLSGAGRSAQGAQVSSDPLDAITAVDALKTLRFVAGFPQGATASPSGDDEGTCPPLGSETVAGQIVGDVDCDGDVDAVDALFLLRFIAAFPLPAVPVGCPPVATFVPST